MQLKIGENFNYSRFRFSMDQGPKGTAILGVRLSLFNWAPDLNLRTSFEGPELRTESLELRTPHAVSPTPARLLRSRP